jgi:antitoxin HicB
LHERWFQTIQGAVHDVEFAVQSWIQTAKEFGDPIPKPSVALNFSGQWRMRVPKNLHAALVLQAKEEGG